jgi:poly(3-hydroxybutyrate) depolymerase
VDSTRALLDDFAQAVHVDTNRVFAAGMSKGAIVAWIAARSGRRVMLVTVKGGGHGVSGSRQYLPKSQIGPVCKDFDNAEVMWELFKSSGFHE